MRESNKMSTLTPSLSFYDRVIFFLQLHTSSTSTAKYLHVLHRSNGENKSHTDLTTLSMSRINVEGYTYIQL